MNSKITLCIAAALAAAANCATAQSDYTNFVRQVQTASGVEWDVQVAQEGQQLSPLSIDPGGARFELWTVRNNPLTGYLLDHTYVGTYVPAAAIRIYSEDPYEAIPRTRADRPFNVEITVSGLLPEDPSAPDAAKVVKAMRHLQSYGEGGDGTSIDRNEAILHAQTWLIENKTYLFQFAITKVPGENRAKVRGEERFTVETIDDYQAPASQLSSEFIQIWPVADAAITGVENNQLLRFAEPPIELHLNDLYPSSETWAHVYPGNPQLGQEGTIIAGSAVVISSSLPESRVLRISGWGNSITHDGRWTLEVLTKTPFGIERLTWVAFDVDRTLRVNGAVTTVE